MKPLTGVHAITFDVGGTLLYPWPSVGEIYAEVMGRHGLQHTPEELDRCFAQVWNTAHLIPRGGSDKQSEKRWWREVVFQLLDILGHPHDFEGLFEELWVTFCDPKRWKLCDGAVEVLVELRRRGYQLAILSNWDERLRPLLQAMDLEKYFDDIVISSEVEAEKPHPEIFELTATRLNLHPEKIVHIGDSEHHDEQGAIEAGWRCVLVAPSSAKPGRKLGSLRELLQLFPALEK